jgi:hypothetical protein
MEEEKKKKTAKPFWELNLNPITMYPPIKESYKENSTKRYYSKSQPDIK